MGAGGSLFSLAGVLVRLQRKTTSAVRYGSARNIHTRARILGRSSKEVLAGDGGIAVHCWTGRIVQQVEVVKPLGMGLDEAAIATVRTWKFEPGTLDGKPVAVKLSADVSFSLITDCKEKKIKKAKPRK